MSLFENELRGRYHLWYDPLEKTFYFSVMWGPGHSVKRTVTEEEADTLERILMGGAIL